MKKFNFDMADFWLVYILELSIEKKKKGGKI